MNPTELRMKNYDTTFDIQFNNTPIFVNNKTCIFTKVGNIINLHFVHYNLKEIINFDYIPLPLSYQTL